jgi:hypothetical protein
MDSAPVTDRDPRLQEPCAIVEAPPLWYDKLVAILFLIGIGVFGIISLADLLANFFR